MKSTCIPSGLCYLFLVSLWILTACSPSTEITASWKNPDNREKKANILIAALTHDMAAKATVERELETALKKTKLDVTKSATLFAPNFTDNISKDKAVLLSKIRENGNDAILTITLLDQQTDTRYVPGSATYAPTVRYGFYGGFYSYYNYYYPTVYDPGYYTQDKTYFLESNLYDADTEALLWSAQSQTYNPTNLDQFAEEFAKITVARLKSEGLI